MIHLKKYLFLALVFFLSGIFALVTPRSAQSTHQIFSCSSEEHTDAVCALPAELGTSTFCFSSSISEACIDLGVDPDLGINTYRFTTCTDCEVFGPGWACSDTTFSCVPPAPISTPTPTPTPALLCSPSCGTCTIPGFPSWYKICSVPAAPDTCIIDGCTAPPTPIPPSCSDNGACSTCVAAGCGWTGTPVDFGSFCQSGTASCPGTSNWYFGNCSTNKCAAPPTPAPGGPTLTPTPVPTKAPTPAPGGPTLTPTPVPTVGPGTPTPIPPTPTPVPTAGPTPTPTTGDISGIVYLDDGDGVKESGEPGYKFGATVTLKLKIGTTTTIIGDPATTDTSGNFSFPGLTCGPYIVSLTVPSGFKLTTSNDVKINICPGLPGPVFFGILDKTPPTVSVSYFPSSPKENCQVTVTTTASDPESGLKRVEVTVDLDKDGTPGNDDGESFFCNSPPSSPFECEWKLPILPAGKYKYYGGAESNSPDTTNNTNSTSKSSFFTITPIAGTLQCLEADGCKCTKIATAIGPISVQGASFVTRIMSLLLGISGGIAVLLIILAGYTLMTSRDKPEAIQESRQKLMGAIAGLLFIALALVVLQVIGVNILQIPGFEP